MVQTLRSLSFARAKHKGQRRKDDSPYIIHLLTMACNALSMGIRDDTVIATILLHDVCEDCGVALSELPINAEVKRAVELMTFTILEGETRENAKVRYYSMMRESHPATLCK